MSYHFQTNRRPGLPAQLGREDIHPTWCACRSCRLDRRHNLHIDFGVIALGVLCGLLVAASIWLLGIK